MKVTHFPNKITDKKTSLVLGSFESFHNGHMDLLIKANELNKNVCVMLIENVSNIPGASKEEYAPLDVRLQNLANLKVEFAIVVKFTPELRLMDGKEFIAKMIESCNAEYLVMGKDFKVGKGGEYKAIDIQKDYPKSVILEHKKVNDTKISTSILKEMVVLGDVDVIRKISPFPFQMQVHVSASGEFKLTNEVKPHSGVYAVMVDIRDIRYWGVAHISQGDVHKLIIPDFQVKNTPVDAVIHYFKLIKYIINSKSDIVEEKDKTLAAQYLKNVV